MGELGALVEAWRDRRDPRPSDAWIGQKVGARSRSTVGPWLNGTSMPKPEHLRALASLIGLRYRDVLDAALLDAGYLEEREYRGDTTPTTAAGSAPAAPPYVSSRRARARTSPQTAPTPPLPAEKPRPARP